MGKAIVSWAALFAAAWVVAEDITPEKYPDADVVLVDDRTEIVYQADGTSVTTNEEWRKALTERGRRTLSTLSIDYSLRYGKGEIVLVEIVGEDGRTRTVDFRESLKEATDNSATSMNIYDPLDRTLSCSVPGIKIGETRHVVTRRTTTKSRIKDQWADVELFESTYPVVRASVKIDGPLARPLKTIAMRNPLGNVASSVVTNGERIVYGWTAGNSPQMFPEPAMPPWWTQAQHLRVSTAADWREISKWYWEVSRPHLEATHEAMTNKVQEILASAGEDKIAAIYKFVSQEVRYMGLTMEDTSPGYAPHDVSVTFDNRYGVCRDKAALLVSLLRIAGFDAYPVLISVSEAKMDAEVPSPFFNHAIVAVRDEEGYRLMDPTDESSRDLMPSYLSDCSYLVAHPEGETLRTSPVVPPERNRVAISGKGTLSRDGSLLVDYSLAFSGLNDNVYRRALLSRKSEKRREFFEGIVAGVAPGADLLSCEIAPKDLQETSAGLTARLLVRFPEVLLRGETRDELSIPALSSALGMANWLLEGRTALERRRYPLKIKSTASTGERLEIDLAGAVGATLSLPSDEKIAGGYAFSRTFSRDGDTLVFARSLSVGAIEFSPDEYLELRERIKRIEASERAKPSFMKDSLADANVRCRSWVRTFDLTGDRSWVATNSIVKEVLTYKGKKESAELKFAFNPSWKHVEVVEAVVSNRNGQVVHAGEKEINLLDVDWVAAAPRYPASKELVVNLPSVEIGSVISYTTVTTVTNAPVPFHGTFLFDVFTPTDFLSVRMGDWKRDVQNPKLLADEPMLPPDLLWRDTVTFATGNFDAAAAQYRALDPEPLDPSAILAESKPKGAGREARARAIRDWMARHVRCVGPGFGEIRLEDHVVDPAVVLKERYATRIGYIRTLCALLKGAGFAADIVFASNEPQMSLNALERHVACADIACFPSALCRLRVRTGGFLWWGGETRTYFLGTENEYTPLGATAFDGAAFLDPQSAEFGVVSVPDASLANAETETFGFSVRENGAVDVDYRREYTGAQVGSARKRYAEMLPEMHSRHFQRLLGAVAQAASATRELETDVEGYPFALTFSAFVPGMAVCAGDTLSLDLSQFLRNQLFNAKGTVRENPIGIAGEDAQENMFLEIRFPEGFTETEHLPGGCLIANPDNPGEIWFTAETSVKTEDGAAVVAVEVRRYARRDGMLPPDRFAQLKEWNRLVGSKANTTVVARRARKNAEKSVSEH